MLIQVAAVGKLFPTIFAGKSEYLFVNCSFVFLQIFCILGDVTTDITVVCWSLNGLVGQVHSVRVQLVLLQVAPPDVLVTDVALRVLRGGRLPPGLGVVAQQAGVMGGVAVSVVVHLHLLAGAAQDGALVTRHQDTANHSLHNTGEYRGQDQV